VVEILLASLSKDIPLGQRVVPEGPLA